MKKFLEAIMYMIRREQQQPKLPTGPNPLPPLSDFEVKRKQYACNLSVPYGQYMVDIDVKAQVGFFEHALAGVNGRCGQFWLAGATLIASDHILPSDVKFALKSLSIEIA